MSTQVPTIPAAVLADGETVDPQADVRLADMAPDPFTKLILLDRAVERYSIQEKRSPAVDRYAKLPLQAPGFEKAVRIATLDQNDVAVSAERTGRMKKTIRRLMNKRAAMDPMRFGALVDDAVESWRECLAEYADFAPGREAMIQGLLRELQAEVDQANQERAREAEKKKLEDEEEEEEERQRQQQQALQRQQSTQSPLQMTAASSPNPGANQAEAMNAIEQQMQQQMVDALAQRQQVQEQFLQQQAAMQQAQMESEIMRQQREMALKMSQEMAASMARTGAFMSYMAG